MKKKSAITKIILYVVLVALAVSFLVPLLWGVASSFRPLEEIFKYATPVTWKTFVPMAPTLGNYKELFRPVDPKYFSQKVPYVLSLFNSLFIALATVAIGLFVNSLAGLAFAKFDFPAKNVLFLFVLLSFMVPFETIVIPLYILMASWNWTDTYFALILPAVANGLAIFIFKQFFQEIPNSLIDAAKIDGASWPKIYLRIIFPISKPVMICTSIMLLLLQWDSFFWPLVVATEERMTVLQVAIARFWTRHGVQWNLALAGSMFASIIPVVIFLLLQRYYVQGIALSGLKE